MTPIINIYAVTVADFIGIAILLVILVSRGWSLPGRKEESHILLRMLIMSVINCIVDQLVAFYDGKLEPFAVQASEAMTDMTFTRREIGAGNAIVISANRLQYASTHEKLQVSAQMADRGIMNRNEIREIWGLPPIEGGDIFLVRGEYKDPDKVEVSDAGNETAIDNLPKIK